MTYDQPYENLPRTQREAYKAKQKFFFTGKPCLHGHLCPRYESSGGCIECTKIKNQKMWYRENPEKYREYIEKNKQKIYRRRAAKHRERVQTDPVYAMKTRIRSLVGVSLKRRGYTKRSSANQILGCTWEEFSTHIEKQFLKGMSWENMGAWEIDHIVPLATAKTEQDVIALNHFTNLRPLWTEDNQSKKAKITHLL